MVYAVDIVCNAMQKLSSSRPALFQRDGMLYVVSKEGFGQVNYGLETFPRREQSREPEAPEILKSENILIQPAKGFENAELKKSEVPYLNPVCFGPDTREFSLEKITRAGDELAQLPDDGNIRMVSHDTSYHSHKYGYAVDGIDVFLLAARTMGREQYLSLMRKKEETLLAELENFKESINKYRKDRFSYYRNPVEEYRQKNVPGGVILTPHLLVTFPQKGILNVYNANNAWSPETQLRSPVVDLEYIDTQNESPFRMQMIVNHQFISAENAKNFAESCDTLTQKLGTQIATITKVVPDMDSYISKLNALHQNVCAEEITYWKKFHEDISKETART